jgi:glycosyltransferase involved in cell wall biosynthesis
MAFIQIFIVSYNRPGMVLNSVRSALNQDFNDFEVILSDNSTNDLTNILASKIIDQRFSYKRRKPSLSAVDHFNLVLKEVRSEYFMIFHDDDQMLPNMLSQMAKCILDHKDSGIIAVGSNALIMSCNKIKKSPFKKNFYENLLIYNSTELVKLYFLKNQIVPFASYMYNKSVTDMVSFSLNKGGKYSDVAFLIDICLYGKIINIAEPLMILNQHDEQDSGDNIFEDKLKLINYIIKTTKFKRNDPLVLNYRLINLYAEALKKQKKMPMLFLRNRNLKIMLILLKSNKYDLILKYLVLTIINLLFKKQNIII